MLVCSIFFYYHKGFFLYFLKTDLGISGNYILLIANDLHFTSRFVCFFFNLRIEDDDCCRIYSSPTIGEQMACKENVRNTGRKELQESVNRCTGRHDLRKHRKVGKTKYT